MRRRRDKKKRLWGWLGWVIPAMAILLLMAFAVTYVLGWHYNVTSGDSMEPTYYASGVVITRPVAPETIEIGDIIMFEVTVGDVKGFNCHRVIDITTNDEGLFFQTQGDNNPYPDDDLVPAEALVGKEAFYIPKIGRATSFYQGNLSAYGKGLLIGPLVIAFFGLIIIAMESSNIYDWLFRRRDVRRQERLHKIGRR